MRAGTRIPGLWLVGISHTASPIRVVPFGIMAGLESLSVAGAAGTPSG